MGILCVLEQSTSTVQDMGGVAPDMNFASIRTTGSIGVKAFPTVVTEKVNPSSSVTWDMQIELTTTCFLWRTSLTKAPAHLQS